MSRISFSGDGLTFEKNILAIFSSGKRIYSNSGSFLIPIIEISAINTTMHSGESLISILLKNGTIIELNLSVNLTEIKDYQKSFDKFVETWKSRFDAKTADLLSLP
jgi:hypothetical protein